MDRIHYFRCLLDQGQGGSNRSVLLALTDIHIGSATYPLSDFFHMLNELNKGGADILVWHRHHSLTDRHAAGIQTNACARSHAELVGELPSELLLIDEPR